MRRRSSSVVRNIRPRLDPRLDLRWGPVRAALPLLGALALSACATTGSSGGKPAADPLANKAVRPLSAADLKAGQLPEGFRLGDRLSGEPGADGYRTRASARTWNDPTFQVLARGRGRKVEEVAWIFNTYKAPSGDYLRQAGIQLTRPVGFAEVRPRDPGRLSQSHATSERVDIVVMATDRPGLFARLYSGGGVEALVFTHDASAFLTPEDRFLAFDDCLARLGAAQAAQDWEGVRRLLARSGPWPKTQATPADAAAQAQRQAAAEALAAADAARAAADAAHDAPILAKIRADADAVLQRSASLPPLQQAEALTEGAVQAHATAAALRRRSGQSQPDAALLERRQALAAATCERPGNLPPSHLPYFQWAQAKGAGAKAEQHLQVIRILAPLDACADYASAYEALQPLYRSDLAALSAEKDGERVQDLLEAVSARQAAEAEKAGRSAEAKWIRACIMDLLRSRIVPANRPPVPLIPSADHWRRMHASAMSAAAIRAGGAPTATQVRRLIDLRTEAGKAASSASGANGEWNILNAQSTFLTRQIEEIAHAWKIEADALDQKGCPASALVLRLQRDAALGQSPSAPRNLRTGLADAPDPALESAWPLLREVLPPLDTDTPQVYRLCEMLAEAPCLDWPLFKLLALRLHPGDLRAVADKRGQVLRHARLVLDASGGKAEFVALEQPVDTDADLRAWNTYSGYSQKTIEERRWLNTEGDWITAQKAELEPKTKALNADIGAYNTASDQLKRDSDKLEADRARVNGGDSGAIAAFNQRVKALNDRRTALNQRNSAINTRKTELDPRNTELHRRIGIFNQRVGEQSERMMVEGAAGRVRVDGVLRQALDADLARRLAAYEAGVRQRVAAPADQEREIAAARHLLGRGGAAPDLFGAGDARGWRVLQVEATERAIPWQKTNEARASQIMAWYLQADGMDNERQKKMEDHMLDFVRYRGIETLRTTIRASALPDWQKKQLQERSVQIEKDFFAKKP